MLKKNIVYTKKKKKMLIGSRQYTVLFPLKYWIEY